MIKVVTFGEIMLRLQTPAHQRFIQAQSLEATLAARLMLLCPANQD